MTLVEPAPELTAFLSRPENGAFQGFYAYWHCKGGGKSMPSRGDLDPLEIPRLLPSLFLVDVVPGDRRRFRFRLVGSRIESTGHKGLTGRWAHELQPEFYRDAVLRAYREAALSGEPSIRRIHYGTNGNALRYERVALPLSIHGTSADALLVGTDWEPANREFFRLYPAIKP